MPLFMDLHKASDYDVKPTVEEIKKNHIADLQVQHKYGVKFLQYWINEEAGLVFCLMEGPDKESCAAVHQEAHGNMPCNIIELKGGDYKALMGDDLKVNDVDIVERKDGSLDTGYRIVMVTDFISTSGDTVYHEAVNALLKKSAGTLLNKPGNREVIVFTTFQQAIDYASHIIRSIKGMDDTANEIRISISAGEPITNGQEIFADAIRLSGHLCDIAQNGQIMISPQVKHLTKEPVPENYMDESTLRLLTTEDEQFADLLITTVAPMLNEPMFSIDELSKKMGMSRSALYRKITAVTGYSANRLINELRMQKALRLIRNKSGNITQVALEAGFSNPSYFAKSFQKRFGIPPFKVLKLN
jgi:AraC-like DNA-binding protein